MQVLKGIRRRGLQDKAIDLYTFHPELFERCPYIDRVFLLKQASLNEYTAELGATHELVPMFFAENYPHNRVDTFNMISVPLGMGELHFSEKQLEYFPKEDDMADAFDVVLNTSITWPTRTWPVECWQRLADELVALGLQVAVVGKDSYSEADGMLKLSLPLRGCHNLVNVLSLDQTFYTLRKAKLFVSCQNGLSVLASATDVEIVVLNMSIEWSKHAIFRNEDPHYKVIYVSGHCDIYCGSAGPCPLPSTQDKFKCIPSYDRVARVVLDRAQKLLDS